VCGAEKEHATDFYDLHIYKERDMDEVYPCPCPTEHRVTIKVFELAMTSLTYGIPSK